MKKIIFLFFFILPFLNSFSQKNNTSTAIIGTYSDETGIQMNFTVDIIKGVVDNFIAENPEIGFSGSLVDAEINDSLPTHDSSIAYLVLIFESSTENKKTSLGVMLKKEVNENGSIKYFLDSPFLEKQDDGIVAAKKWTCKTPDGCGGCKPIRTGFLGLGGVVGCKCPNFEGTCTFERTGGSDFPWTLVGSVVTIILTAVINNN